MVKKIWLTGQGIISRPNQEQLFYNVTFENIHLVTSFYPDLSQIHLRMEREELILLREAINKEIKESEVNK